MQALTFPKEVAIALAVWLVLAGQPVVATVVLLCFMGLFRASELLHLTFEHFFMSAKEAVFVLGIAKRGLEQKVVIVNTSVLACISKYVQYMTANDLFDSSGRVFPVSYGKLSYWIKKGMLALNVPGHWTSHGLRRGGATELLRLHTPLPDIANFGRWLSERSMREYLRRGEVSLLRLRGDLSRQAWQVVRSLLHLGINCWDELA